MLNENVNFNLISFNINMLFIFKHLDIYFQILYWIINIVIN